MTALVHQIKPLECARKIKGCKNPAEMRITYRQITNEPTEIRNLCNSCFNMPDEKGIKVFQVGIADVTPLEWSNVQ